MAAFVLFELNSYNRDPMACKAWNIYYLVLYKKGLLTPILYQQQQMATATHSAEPDQRGPSPGKEGPEPQQLLRVIFPGDIQVILTGSRLLWKWRQVTGPHLHWNLPEPLCCLLAAKPSSQRDGEMYGPFASNASSYYHWEKSKSTDGMRLGQETIFFTGGDQRQGVQDHRSPYPPVHSSYHLSHPSF